MAGDDDLGLSLDPAPNPNEIVPVTETINDYTAPRAKGRTLFLNFKRLKFGIDDKTLSIALVLTVLLLGFILIFGIISIWSNNRAVSEILDALIKALFMAIGVIVSRNVKDDHY